MLTQNLSTKDKIQRAALSLVAHEGFSGATTARIAAKAGVAEGSIYRHFKNKDELMLSIYRRIKGEVYLNVMDGYDESTSAHERFTHIWSHVFAAYRADPDAMLFAQKFAETPLLAKEGGKAHKEMARVLAQLRDNGVAAGVFKAIAADLLISLFYAPIIALLRAENSGRHWDEGEINAACEAAFDSWSLTRGRHD